MVDSLETDSSLIEPVYSQAEPNQTIDLGSIVVEFAYGGKTVKERACVSMRFTPDDRLLFVIPAEGKDPLFGLRNCPDDDWDGKLRLTDRDVTLDVMWIGSGGACGALAFMPKTSVVTVTQPSEDLTDTIFHLFNFPDFSGPEDYTITTGDSAPGGRTRCGRVTLKADGWNITIAATRKTHHQCKTLRREGGFITTHVGKIGREDGSLFSSEQLGDLLSCVHHFLSFASGRWAGVALPIGFDRNGNRVFEQWGMPLVAPGPWNGSCSWFDALHSEILVEVFPGFAALWKDETWNSAIRAALYWYLGANERGTGIGVDTGLILAQTGLERLAWTYCVLDRKMISANDFRSRMLSAAEKIRPLMSSLDIPVDLPGHTAALGEIRDPSSLDGLDAITRVRNFVVHPHAKKQLPDGSYYEAWKLSLWYLDMVFLRLCGHQGSYANRLVTRCAGDVGAIPWAQLAATEETGE